MAHCVVFTFSTSDATATCLSKIFVNSLSCILQSVIMSLKMSRGIDDVALADLRHHINANKPVTLGMLLSLKNSGLHYFKTCREFEAKAVGLIHKLVSLIGFFSKNKVYADIIKIIVLLGTIN